MTVLIVITNSYVGFFMLPFLVACAIAVQKIRGGRCVVGGTDIDQPAALMRLIGTEEKRKGRTHARRLPNQISD
jgi:hypothetical protein